MSEVRRAANFFRLIKLSYGSKCVSFGSQPYELEHSYPAIRGAHRRLTAVVIENKGFEALLRQYDKPEAFFYLGPPYFGTEDNWMRDLRGRIISGSGMFWVVFEENFC